MQDKLLKPIEAAKLLNMSRASLYIWIQQGRIKPVRLPTGKYRSSVFVIESLLNEANPDTKVRFMPLGEEKP